MKQISIPGLTEYQFQLILMSKPFHYVNLRADFRSWALTTRQAVHTGWELPKIQIKYLNPFSLCLSCSRQGSWLPATAAAAMWEELSTSKGCPHAAKAESPSLPPSLLLPPAPSLLHTWGREDDYHQSAVLQCPDGHLPPAVHCRSVMITVCSSVSLVWFLFY